ncbi:MAG: orotidine-5-phosphate decarboxylase [Solirubrobacteraceae bacterium]|nr:orotidine-5-phosphate decarboxylase [Solirubrobacteraceae bacterium]
MSASALHFGDRLARAVAQRESQIVLGLDPHPAQLWPAGRDALDALTSEAPAAAAAAGVTAHCRAVIDAAGPACVAVKPQLACFERLGAPGWAALADVAAYARAAGLLVLLDGKRGDVPVTAGAYGQALVTGTPTPHGDVPGLGGDAFTVNPLLGRDAVAPLIEAGRAAGAGPFLLVRTSNPGATDVFDLRLAAGGAVWERLAAMADELGAPGPESGLADVGAVAGATVPQHLARMRELMPRTPFLLPGVGAQGGDVATLGPAFAAGRAGGLVTSSRGIVNAYEAAGGTPADAARSEAERLREVAWRLA